MTRRKKDLTDDEKRAGFLEHLATNGNITEACKASGLPRKTAYRWRHADPEFDKAWKDAEDLGTDGLEDEANRRGFVGTLKPIYQGGLKVGTVREYSDTLLIFLLKGRRPAKFKDRIAHGGDADAPPIKHENLTDAERLDRLAALYERVGAGRIGSPDSNGRSGPNGTSGGNGAMPH